EPNAKNALSPALCDSFQPAYWLAKHAITGLDERVEIIHGQFGAAAVGVTATSPNPPMQISAIRSPAAMPPGKRLPASINLSPSEPCATPIFSKAASATRPSTSFVARILMLSAVVMAYSRASIHAPNYASTCEPMPAAPRQA